MESEEDRTFEQNLGELEGLVRRLDGGDIPLEEALSAFERGVALVRALHATLNQAEQRVEVLSQDRDGCLRLEPAPGAKV
jgi:exodeoxyribonuclease VII small subunit